MNFANNCDECKRLSASYEAATMDWFRLQGQLRIATLSNDPAASDRMVAELSGIAQRREQLRQSAEAHLAAAHPRRAAAGSPLS